MKLHYGQYYWPTVAPKASRYPHLNTDITCDVLVVGGGMGGALTTKLLTNKNIDTVLVERHQVASGSSLANTGLLQFSNDKTLTSLIHTFGEQDAVHFYRLCRDAIQHLLRLSQEFPEEARVIPRGSLYFASTTEDVDMLREEYSTLKRYGFDAAWWNDDQISTHFPFKKPAAIYTKGDAEVNPYAFVHSLVEHSVQQGAKVYEESSISGCEFTHDRVICRCGHSQITAKHVIFTTGYETQQYKREKGAELTSSYVIVTEPLKDFRDWYEQSLIWETARPYYYLRTTQDGRIIAGGLDESLPGGELVEGRYLAKSKQLLDYVHQMFPQTASIQAEYRWVPYSGTHMTDFHILVHILIIRTAIFLKVMGVTVQCAVRSPQR
ncbi:FAD-dependent oxidoreductase [Paenibacillus sp. D2_2]|uniref:NAD(P)/FAD-dependent oxidoreductase n=1 Tax=Paenibacillus sp. D2_2 TaxID=3073092 RepID=UPI00281642F4|nr:FAD-dependent oxidoreductase [Paenibacillus sp. D2_2]WMT39817.1 FAD-dependent oxidoreductase [Paenibacillus sp. D2_2]